MKGYKIAFHEERIGGKDVLNGLYYGTTITKIPVLVVLDIPDDAQTSTPESRYTEEKMAKMRNEWSRPIMPSYVAAALKECTAYHAYKDEDPLTIYNELIKEYDGALSKFLHASKCRCNGAKVVDIIGVFNGIHYTHAVSVFDSYFIYELGKTVSCEDFNACSRMAVCAPGIHYFEYPVFAILYMLEGMDFLIAPVRDGKIDFEVTETYLTEELNTLKREDKAIEYCKADVAVTERWFEESCRNSAYGLSIPSGKDEVSIAIARQYLTGSEMETTYFYDNMPYVTLRATGRYTTMTITLDNNPENAICICMTKSQAKAIWKGIKGLYKKKKKK